MICSNCKTQLDEKNIFCPQCGTKVEIKINKIFLVLLGFITLIITLFLGTSLMVKQVFSTEILRELVSETTKTEVTNEDADELVDYIFGSASYPELKAESGVWNPEEMRISLYRWMGRNEYILDITDTMLAENFFVKEIILLTAIGVLSLLVLWMDMHKISPVLFLYGTMIVIGTLCVILTTIFLGRTVGISFLMKVLVYDFILLVSGIGCIILGIVIKKVMKK